MNKLLKDMHCEKYFLINRSSISIFYTVNPLLVLQAMQLDNAKSQYLFAPLLSTEIQIILSVPSKHSVYSDRVYVPDFDHAVSFEGCVLLSRPLDACDLR